MGSHKRPFYRLVAADSRYQRDGRFLEILGYYDPMAKPFKLHVERDKVLSWLGKGAQMSETAESLLRKEGIIQEFNREKLVSKSAKRTANNHASSAGEASASQ
jgi:small subunit ribosomal protein S16